MRMVMRQGLFWMIMMVVRMLLCRLSRRVMAIRRERSWPRMKSWMCRVMAMRRERSWAKMMSWMWTVKARRSGFLPRVREDMGVVCSCGPVMSCHVMSSLVELDSKFS